MKVTITLNYFDVNYKISETIVKTTNDSGRFVFPYSTLKKMSDGILNITLERGNKLNGIAPDGKEYSAYLYSQHELAVILQK